MRFSLLRARTRLLHLPSKWNKLVVGGGGHRAFASSVPPASAAPTSSGSANYIRWFKNLSMEDLPEVGGKNASLGEMCQTLTELGVRVPDGFALTAPAYTAALDGLGLQGEGEGLGEGEGTSSSSSSAWTELHSLLDGLNKTDARALSRAGAKARELVFHCPMPAVVEKQLREAWRALKAERGEDLSVAVRSSATAEDLPGASFAGLWWWWWLLGGGGC
jgi:pyruvate,water dikinase